MLWSTPYRKKRGEGGPGSAYVAAKRKLTTISVLIYVAVSEMPARNIAFFCYGSLLCSFSNLVDNFIVALALV